MKMFNFVKWVCTKKWNICYRSQLEYVGTNVKFGGSHITICGGKKNRGRGISIGNDCTIYDYCQLVSDDYDDNCGIVIGSNCHFNYNCYLCGTGGLRIGSDCIFGPGVKIIPTNHRFDDVSRNIMDQGHTNGGVVVGDNVWVGAGAIILEDVRVERGAIISAGAVVTRDGGKDSIVAGRCAGDLC